MTDTGRLITELVGDGEAGPVYRRIAEAIASGVRSGRLSAGDRLPTHRSLAAELGVAVPTVTRAYREAEQQGLISSTVGRGTFVSGIPHLRDSPPPGGPVRLDMSVNAPALGEHEELLRRTLAALAASGDAGALLGYEPDVGSHADRVTAARWLALGGPEVDPAGVAICHGGQHALLVALAATLQQGEVLLTESLTYPGVKSAARLLGLGTRAVAMDGDGLIPGALEAACLAGTAPRALYCMPTAHNPTATTLPLERRQALVDIARRHDLTIIEDDVFAQLEPAPVALATLAPERTLYLASLSKSLTPGLRTGFVAGPAQLADRLGAVVRATVFNPAPLSTAVAMRWLNDGTAERLLTWQRAEMATRRAAAADVLGGSAAVTGVRTAALHAWVDLARPWTAAEFVELARGLGIDISPTVFFCAADQDVPRGVRLCLGNAADTGVLTAALRSLAEGLERGPTWSSGIRV